MKARLHFSRKLFAQNWQSGLTVALISVPLSIALSIASGAGPMAGIITGIWATIIASLFCSSNYNIIGAAGALTPILFAATVAAPTLGAGVLPLLAIGTGIALFILWVLNADRYLYYIPSSVMYGFSAGVAFLIAASQLFDATGLSALKRTGTFVGDIMLFAQHTSETSPATAVVFAVFFAFILTWKHFVRRIPAVIPAAILGIVFGLVNEHVVGIDLVTLGSKFGSMQGELFHSVSWHAIFDILSSNEQIVWFLKTVGVISIIAVLETLITAKMGDLLTRTQSSSKRELFGLALANIASGIAGGLPATGVFVRTGANIKSGATHRTSAFIAGAMTALIALLVLPAFALMPVAVISAILVNTGIGLIEVGKFKLFFKHDRSSFAVAILVAVITVLDDAGTGVITGAIISLLLYADSVSRGRFDAIFNFSDGTRADQRGAHMLTIPTAPIDTLTYSIAGFLGYLDSSSHAANLKHIAHVHNVKHVIVRLRDLFILDREGAEMLAEAVTDLRKSGKAVYISSANETIREKLSTYEAFCHTHDAPCFYEKTRDALERTSTRI